MITNDDIQSKIKNTSSLISKKYQVLVKMSVIGDSNKRTWKLDVMILKLLDSKVWTCETSHDHALRVFPSLYQFIMKGTRVSLEIPHAQTQTHIYT